MRTSILHSVSGCARSESPWFRSPYVTCWSRFRGFAGQGFRGDTTPLDSRRGEEEELWEEDLWLPVRYAWICRQANRTDRNPVCRSL